MKKMEKMKKNDSIWIRILQATKDMTILIPLVLLCFAACDSGRSGSSETPFSTLRIATWNVQALFDGTEIGNEYAEYHNAAGWTDEKYTARLNALSQAIEQMDEKVPDILSLIEIENAQILTDMVQGPLAKQGYYWTFFGTNPGYSLGIGMISRFPFEQTTLHSMTCNGETIPRPLLEVRFRIEDTPLVCFVCHWKSKQGGAEATESLRKAAARILLRRLQEIQQEDPALPVVIMGDLNENHDEFYRKEGLVISALLPDDPRAAELADCTSDASAKGVQKDFLILSQQKPPQSVYFASEAVALYSPWGQELQEGSYMYQNSWETIDHFLLSPSLFDQKGWVFDACRVIKQEPFINAKGCPATYNPRTGNGLSDHLPLILVLRNIAFQNKSASSLQP